MRIRSFVTGVALAMLTQPASASRYLYAYSNTLNGGTASFATITDRFYTDNVAITPQSCVVNGAFCDTAVIGHPFRTSDRFDAHTYPSNIPTGIKNFFNVPQGATGSFTTSLGEKLVIRELADTDVVYLYSNTIDGGTASFVAVTSGFFDGSLEAVPTVSCVVNNAFCSQAVLGYPFQTSSRFDAHTYPSNIPSGIKSFFNVPADTAGMFTTSRGERLTIIGPAPAAVTAVPEPASWATLIAGFAIAGIALRRRKVAVRFG